MDKRQQYKRTRDIDEVREGFQERVSLLQTDYIEVVMIHYVDSMKDWEAIAEGPVPVSYTHLDVDKRQLSHSVEMVPTFTAKKVAAWFRDLL